MGTALEPLPSQPLNARRPGAPPLPTFQLPAPTFSAAALRYPLQSHPLNHTHPPPQNSSVSNLIASAVATQPGDAAATTTATTTTTTAATSFSSTTTVTAPTATATSAAASTPVSASHDLSSYWATQGSYSGGPGATVAGRQAPWTPGPSSSYSNRDPLSPSFHHFNRNAATSTPGAEAIPSAYDMNQLPPFHQQLAPPPPPPHPVMTHGMLAAQNGGAGPHPPLPPNDPYMTKSSSAPTYGAMQQLSAPPYHQPYGAAPPPPPPPPPTGLGMHHPPRVASNPPPPPPPSHLSYQRQPWPSYSLPAMTGPVMSNVHSPGSQMSLLGPLQSGLLPGFNSGHVASMQQMYGGHPPHLAHGPAGPTNDRPFKCDQCPQSFNRNHDLKRHKRIHLSVKPFPCTHCDKSFSRKDALKRHILVKGCGKDGDTSAKAVKEEDKGEEDGHTS